MRSRLSALSRQLLVAGRGMLRRPHYKLIGLLVALGVWLYVQGEQVVQDRIQAQVEWITPVGLLSTAELPQTVSLVVEGSVSAVRKARRADVSLIADLSEATTGETTVDFATLRVRGLPGSVAVETYSPSSIRFVLDEAEARKVAVAPVTVGEPSPGYAVVGVELDPAVVEIRGPRVLVSDLVEVSTKPVDVSGLAGDSDLPAEVDLPRTVDLVGEVDLVARVDVEATVETRTFTGVKVLFQEEGWWAEPEELLVRLRGPAAALRDIPEERVLVLARLPVETEEEHHTLAYGPTEGARLELVYPGDPVQEVVVPQTVEVYRR